MANGLSRVTVMGPDRALDLALPGAVSIGELMPQLLELCTEHGDRTRATAWLLRPLGGRALGWAGSLESADVRDGAILELCPRSGPVAATTVEDVRDATEDLVDGTVRIWSRRDATTAALLVLALLAGAGLGLPAYWTAFAGNGVVVAAMTAVAAIGASVAVASRGLRVPAHALLATGLGWTAGLVMAATTTSLAPSGRAALGGAAIVCAASVATWVVPSFAAWLAAVVILFATGIGWAAVTLMGLSIQDSVACGAVLGVLILGALPRVCVSAGGLAGLDYVVRTGGGGVEPDTVAATFQRSRALLTGALSATALLTAACSLSLGIAGSPIQLAQGVAVAACLLLRARAFSQFWHVLVLVLAGIAALLAPPLLAVLHGAPEPGMLAVLGGVVVASAIGVGGGLCTPSDVAVARGRRLLDAAESVAVSTLIPLLAANLGALDSVAELVN